MSIAATGAVSAIISSLGGDVSGVPGACTAAADPQAAAAIGMLASAVLHTKILHLV